MPLCQKCGTDNHESLEECLYCGHTLQSKKPVNINPLSSIPRPDTNNQPLDIGFFIQLGLALFFPFIGFIMFLNASIRRDKKAKYLLLAALLNIVWSVIVSINTV
ncbi:MAG: hypothetical protein ACPF9F_00820 [Acholeplasmataceae bacterium]